MVEMRELTMLSNKTTSIQLFQSYAAMAKAGVQVIEATPQLVSDLKAASVKVWNDPKWEKAYTKEVMDRIKKEAGK